MVENTCANCFFMRRVKSRRKPGSTEHEFDYGTYDNSSSFGRTYEGSFRCHKGVTRTKNLVTGMTDISHNVTFCRDERSANGSCGPEGKNFKEHFEIFSGKYGIFYDEDGNYLELPRSKVRWMTSEEITKWIYDNCAVRQNPFKNPNHPEYVALPEKNYILKMIMVS